VTNYTICSYINLMPGMDLSAVYVFLMLYL